MAYDVENIFAKILRGEAPAFKVYEDEFSLAFMDVMPQVPGHTLVIPKDPTEDVFSADPVILGHTINTVQTVAAAVKKVFDAPGIMLAQLNGAAAGQPANTRLAGLGARLRPGSSALKPEAQNNMSLLAPEIGLS